MVSAESKEKGLRLPILAEPHPKAGIMAEICKRWVSGIKIRVEKPPKVPKPPTSPEVSDDEMDRRALEIWERKARPDDEIASRARSSLG